MRLFTVEISGFSDADVGRWFLSSGAILILNNADNSLPLAPLIIEFNDGACEGWIMQFVVWDSAVAVKWLNAIDYEDGLLARTIQGDLAFPDKAEDRRRIKSFVDFCRGVIFY